MGTPYEVKIIEGNLAEGLNTLYLYGWRVIQVLESRSANGKPPEHRVLLKHI